MNPKQIEERRKAMEKRKAERVPVLKKRAEELKKKAFGPKNTESK